MTDSTVSLLPGVDKHGVGWRVRKRFGNYRHLETGFATPSAANLRAAELDTLREAGLRPTAAPRSKTLGEVAEALVADKARTVSRKTKRRLSDGSMEWWRRITRPWREGEYASLPLSLLRREWIDEYLDERTIESPHAARNELDGLKAVLRSASRHGASFDVTILEIERPAVVSRARVALTADQLEFFVIHAPGYGWRMLLFKGTVGNRIGELFTLVDARVDLAERTIFIPAKLCKERADKTIDLTAEEAQLLREQLLARAPGTKLVFPKKGGSRWRYGDWHALVWSKTVRRASIAWRETHGLPDDAPTPFQWPVLDEDGDPIVDDDGREVWDGLQPHDLRATAATLMRDAGFTREHTAARLGHADTGQLLDRLYDRGDRRKRAKVREAIDEMFPRGIRAALAETTPLPSDRPAAEGSAN